MRSLFLIAVLFSSFQFSFCQKALDNSATHAYFKLTCFPFLYENHNPDESIALGPSVSAAGERLEIQVGVLRDFAKYEEWVGNHFQSAYSQYRNIYLPVFFRVHIRITERIYCPFSFGIMPRLKAGSSTTSQYHGYTRMDYWGAPFLGIGLNYWLDKRTRFGIDILERPAEDGKLATGGLFEITWRIK